MNNASLINENLHDDQIRVTPILNKRAQDLTDIIDALQHIAGSSYWTVLQQYIFDVDLEKARKSIAKEKDTVELFRLQGAIQVLEKFSLGNLLTKSRNELEAIRKQLNGN